MPISSHVHTMYFCSSWASVTFHAHTVNSSISVQRTLCWVCFADVVVLGCSIRLRTTELGKVRVIGRSTNLILMEYVCITSAAFIILEQWIIGTIGTFKQYLTSQMTYRGHRQMCIKGLIHLLSAIWTKRLDIIVCKTFTSLQKLMNVEELNSSCTLKLCLT